MISRLKNEGALAPKNVVLMTTGLSLTFPFTHFIKRISSNRIKVRVR